MRLNSQAVRRVFKWTEDAGAVGIIVVSYKDAMKKISGVYIKKKNLQVKESVNSAQSFGREEAPTAPTEEDILQLQLDAWTETARIFDRDPPNIDEVQLATFGSPFEAIMRVFKWTDDLQQSQDMGAIFQDQRTELSKKLMQRFNQGSRNGAEGGSNSPKKSEKDEVDLPLFALRDGAIDWLQTLQKVEMPCAMISYLERPQVDIILEQTGLANFFPPQQRVTATNAYRGEGNELLGAALRLERRPDHCSVFVSTPLSALAAHDSDMMSVAMIGIYPNYDLLAADMTAKYFYELRTQNLRGLFSEVRLDEPEIELQQNLKSAPRPFQTRYWEEGDRP